MPQHSAFVFGILCLLIFCSHIPEKNIGPTEKATANIGLENKSLRVAVDEETGCFSVIEKVSGQVWNSDPWENAAGLLTLSDNAGKIQTVNLSKSRQIESYKKTPPL